MLSTCLKSLEFNLGFMCASASQDEVAAVTVRFTGNGSGSGHRYKVRPWFWML
jgi:hypothetical protein